MSYIAEILKKKYLNKIPTPTDLVYKEKSVDIFHMSASYEALVKEGKYIKSTLLYGKEPLYLVGSDVLGEAFEANHKLNFMIQSIKSPNDAFSTFMSSEIFNSLWIEGVRSSKKKIKQFLKNKNINVDTELKKLTRNFDQALEFVLSTDTIDEPRLFALYQILSRDIDMGNDTLKEYPYRTEEVQIGNDEENLGIKPTLIKGSMESIFNLIKQLEAKKAPSVIHEINALLIHYLFEQIHPYYDMNGRMGRLLSIWYSYKFKVFPSIAFFSEAIHLFKKDFYYDAFKKSELNGFKQDASYFASALTCALIGQKVIYLIVDQITNDIKSKFKRKINSLQSDILVSLLAKEKDKFYKIQDFILGVNEINPAQVSQALQELVEFGILEEINSKPKEYKLVWPDQIDKTIEGLISSK